MKDQVFVIKPNGNVLTLYDDALPFKGQQTIKRASNVEPGVNGWDVVLTDDERNGKFKGHVVVRGVLKRSDALAMEVDFINKNILGGGDNG